MKKFLLLFLIVFSVSEIKALTLTLNHTNVSCNGGCNGTVTAVPSGGTPPYTYSWNPVNFGNPISGLCAGTYTCTVTDQVASTATAVVTVSQPPALTSTISTTNVSCNAMCDGALTATGNGGTPPYNYQWSNSAIIPTISNLCPATYTVTVTDANACTSNSIATVTQPAAVPVTISPMNPTICSGDPVTLTASGAMTYVWNPSNQTTASITVNPTVGCTYTVTGMDAMGCNGYAVTQIYVNQPPTATASSVEAGCNFSNGSGTVTPAGNSPFTYNWLPNSATTPTANNLPAGTYSVDITDANGCTVQTLVIIGDSCDFVWPGDANDDAIADNNDILDIGIANGATGTTRANANLNWIGQPSTNWGQTLASGTDYKFVDCNGDGAINPSDTNAVIQNFGFTHNNRTGGIPVYDQSLPDLTVTMGQSILASNSPGTMTIALGNSTTPASNIYGIAFTLNFDASQIDASAFRMNENGTWMGNPAADLIGVVMNSGTGTGAVQVALTRLDHQNANGFGDIANLGFMTTGNLVGTGNTQNVNFTISNVTIIDANENPQTVNSVNDSVTVSDPALMMGISPALNSGTISAFPNPFNESVEIILPVSAKGKTSKVTITDAAGRIVRTETVKGNSFVLARGSMEAGVYFCTVQCEGQTVGNTKLVIE